MIKYKIRRIRGRLHVVEFPSGMRIPMREICLDLIALISLVGSILIIVSTWALWMESLK